MEDNIKMDLKGIGWDGVDWIRLAQDTDQCRKLVKTVMNFRVPYNVGNSLCGSAAVGFSRKTPWT
jgi:hypothetical protein